TKKDKVKQEPGGAPVPPDPPRPPTQTHSIHYFDTQTGQEHRGTVPSEALFKPPSIAFTTGSTPGYGTTPPSIPYSERPRVLRLPRYCLEGARLSPDRKVLVTRTRRQGRASVGLWRLP